MATRAGGRGQPWGFYQYLTVGAATLLLTFALMALSFGPSAPRGAESGMSIALAIHLGTVLPALPLGAYVLLRRKGGATHRLLGRVWSGLMVTTAVSSFWLQDTGRLSFIHLFSVMTLVSVPLAVFWIRRGNVEGHRRAIVSVYIGLVVAGLFAFAPGRLLWVWLFG
jgi:uncharacterized membrane protein